MPHMGVPWGMLTAAGVCRQLGLRTWPLHLRPAESCGDEGTCSVSNCRWPVARGFSRCVCVDRCRSTGHSELGLLSQVEGLSPLGHRWQLRKCQSSHGHVKGFSSGDRHHTVNYVDFP